MSNSLGSAILKQSLRSFTSVSLFSAVLWATVWRSCFYKVAFLVGFYRAMHFSAKRGIAIACRLSVRPSVRPSVCDVGEL